MVQNFDRIADSMKKQKEIDANENRLRKMKMKLDAELAARNELSRSAQVFLQNLTL